MSKFKVPSNVRHALWRAHSKKCVYTNEPIEYANMDIDHIIPEMYLDKKDELINLIDEYGLDLNFEINNYKNLVPCKRGKNLQKGKMTLNKNATHFYLNIALSNHQKFLNLFKKLEGRKAKKNICKLLTDIKFADKSIIEEIETNDINDLWDKPLLIGGSLHIKNVNLSNEKGETKQVKTAREYKEAIELGYQPASNSDNKILYPFKILSRLLSAISNIMPPVQSFISKPRVGIVDLFLLPSEIFTNLTNLGGRVEGDEGSSHKTIQDLLTEGKVKITKVTQNTLCIEDDGMGLYLLEVARGDFNNDGLEDILLYASAYAIGGTFEYGDTHILTRKNESGLFIMRD